MNYLNDPERERILSLAHHAETLAEVEQATVELHRWVSQHPEDLGIRDAFEPLSHRRDFLQAEARLSKQPYQTEDANTSTIARQETTPRS
ncbi:MAG TPA: hypothetical protein VFB38_10045 [Chthonomonadaceae bacterium]|nr:hypothetical protein [Chthonomonadaceae bacterium]